MQLLSSLAPYSVQVLSIGVKRRYQQLVRTPPIAMSVQVFPPQETLTHRTSVGFERLPSVTELRVRWFSCHCVGSDALREGYRTHFGVWFRCILDASVAFPMDPASTSRTGPPGRASARWQPASHAACVS